MSCLYSSAAVAALVGRDSFLVREAEDTDVEAVVFVLIVVVVGYLFPHLRELGYVYRQLNVAYDVSQIAYSQWYGTKEVVFLLVESAETVCTHGLHYSGENVTVELVTEGLLVYIYQLRQMVDVVIEQFFAYGLRHIAFGTIEQRSHIVLGCSLSGTLEVDIV